MRHTRKSLALIAILALSVSGCALVPKAHGTSDQEAARVAKLVKVVTTVEKVGTIVESAQTLEIQLHQDFPQVIPDAKHAVIQAAFLKASGSVQAALTALQGSASAADQAAAVKALADGVGGIVTALGVLTGPQATALTTILAAAKTVIDLAAPLLA